MRRLLLLLLTISLGALAQSNEQVLQEVEDDLTPGADIFSDFNEDLESAQVLEDERFYRYGRFFSVNLGGGFTTFTGNRGRAYEDNPPTFHLSMNYFLDFQSAIILGIEYSKHTMILDTVVYGYKDQGRLGAVVTDFSRVFIGYKYYVDTTDLGTAITYSNPHVIGRLEYWYQTSKFIDVEGLPKDSGGGLGTGIGFGLDFPVEIKKSYIGVEALYHVVNFYDKFTQDFRQVPGRADSTYGYEDLTGNVLTIIFSYNFTW
jgi:hypothetical protein